MCIRGAAAHPYPPPIKADFGSTKTLFDICYMPRRGTTREDVGAVIALYKAGHRRKEIVAQTGVHPKTVTRLIRRFKDNGETYLPVPKPRPGRPCSITPRTKQLISRQVFNNPRLSARELKEKNPLLLGHVSVRNVQRVLHDDLGYKSFKARRKPMLTKQQMERRMQFCTKYKAFSQEEWKKVLWSDEATFTVTGCGTNRVWRRPGTDPLDSRYTSKHVKHPASVMIWGCFGYYGVGELVVLEKNVKVNQYVYKKLLQDHLPQSLAKTQTSFSVRQGSKVGQEGEGQVNARTQVY